MYVETVPNRSSPPAILLREGWREGGKTRKRTIANLSKWPPAKIEALRRLLRDKDPVGFDGAFDITRSLPHGHVRAVLGTLRRLGLERMLDRRASPQRDRAVAMIVARVLEPGSKLATAQGLAEPTARHSLARTLGLEAVDEDDLYEAMDWLLARQGRIEKALARRHLDEGSLVLCDLTSVWMEGRACPLTRWGRSRDGKRGKQQIEFALLCDRDGRPVAVEVFAGNVGDPTTVGPQVAKLRRRFGLERVVLVGDRGLLTSARIRKELRPAGLDWISALRNGGIRKLVAKEGMQFSLFDERDLAEIRSDLYPGERLVMCRNPLLAEERARKRESMLAATEARLEPVAAATRRKQRRLRGKAQIGAKVGVALGRFKMAKHFDWWIEGGALHYRRKEDAIAAEAALDGLYVVRTSVPAAELGPEETVTAYKRLATVERAFRSLKTVDLKVRPVFHHTAGRVRAHVLLCMLAYYVEWHMRRALAPLLFEDDDPAAAAAARTSVVAPAQVSAAARRKAQRKADADGNPVQSFRSLLRHLATITRNTVTPRAGGAEPFEVTTRPTPLQARAFELLEVRPP